MVQHAGHLSSPQGASPASYDLLGPMKVYLVAVVVDLQAVQLGLERERPVLVLAVVEGHSVHQQVGQLTTTLLLIRRCRTAENVSRHRGTLRYHNDGDAKRPYSGAS